MTDLVLFFFSSYPSSSVVQFSLQKVVKEDLGFRHFSRASVGVLGLFLLSQSNFRIQFSLHKLDN